MLVSSLPIYMGASELLVSAGYGVSGFETTPMIFLEALID